MKITKARLKEIIQEETLKEIHSTVKDPLELIQAALGKLDEIHQLVADVGLTPQLHQTLKAHLATASDYLEAASAPLMPSTPAPEQSSISRGIPHSDDEEPHAQRERRYDRRRYGR